MDVLVVNAGSSSVKLRLLDGSDAIAATVDLDVVGGRVDQRALGDAIAGMPRPDVVGHRVVHGGTRFQEAVRIDAEVLAALQELTELAPLHQPKSLAAIEAAQAALPDVPGVACFDTAFHSELPQAAATYALPRVWRRRWGLRRYGFHGLSHSWAARRAAERVDGAGRVVTCHLGAGASLAAVQDGRSVDTTMGFTPLEGLVMATRSGSVDPGLVLWLLEHEGIAVHEMAQALEHESGLAGLAGTADMREVVRAAGHDPDARLALEVYAHRLRAAIAAMAAALGGIDTLVFTGGVGENDATVRAMAAGGLGFLGVRLDAQANEHARPDVRIDHPDAGVRCLVIAAREDVEIARQVRTLFG